MALWNGPTISDTLTANDLITSALDQPMSKISTFWGTGTQAALDSPILGTAITEMRLPPRYIDPNSPVLADRIQALNNDGEPISEDEFKASENYRATVPYDKGMTRERQAALAEMEDIRQARAFYASKRPITALFGTLAGSALDPINYVPFLGPATRAASVARFGRVGGTALVSSADAAINTAVASAATAGTRALYGQDTSFDTIVSDVAIAALIGGAFGTVAGAMGRRADVRQAAALEEAKQRLATLRRTQEARVALNDAVQSLAIDGEVRLSPTSVDIVQKTSDEVARIGAAWDTVRANPNGPALDPIVQILPDNFEGTALARGAFKDVNGEAEFSRRGWGLVKIIWKQGPENKALAPEFQVQRDDVTALPDVIRRYEPASVSADGTKREWRVERGGRVIVYADSAINGQRHVVTTYVDQSPTARENLSPERPAPPPGSTQPDLSRIGDTAGDLTIGTSRAGAAAPIEDISPRPIFGNEAPEAEVRPRSALTANDSAKAVAEQYGVNAETGDFVEAAELDALRNSGRLTEDEIRMLDEADQAKEAGDAFAEALQAAVGCML
jgi:hypothetical protein